MFLDIDRNKVMTYLIIVILYHALCTKNIKDVLNITMFNCDIDTFHCSLKI